MAMNYCPKCGGQLPLGSEKFCPNCGNDLSAVKSPDVDIICPDCNTLITNANEDCPNCGCPSSLFTKQAKTENVSGEVLECPDCGKVFHETIPAECPNCGCPSDKFKRQKVENAPQKSSTQKKSGFSSIIIVLIVVGIIGGIISVVEYNVQQAAEQARQEQYAKEQEERREREKAERLEAERLEVERKRYDESRTKWKEFAGITYRASEWTRNGTQYYAFSYNRSGKGKYFIYSNYPGTNVVEDKMEFSIYKVESEGDYLYLYSYELSTPVKIIIQGGSLYSMTGDRYEIWN